MRPHVLFSSLMLLAMLASAVPLHAQRVGASVNVGTNGVGVGVATSLARNVNGRAQVSFLGFGLTGDQDLDDVDVAYEASANLLFVSGLVDWHPLSNALRLSAGLVVNGTGGNGTLRPIGPVEVGSRTYSEAEMGYISPRLSFSAVAPYVGLGVGNPIASRVGFMLDAGVIYVGSPSVEIEAGGMLSPMSREGAQIEENLRWIKMYPVLSMGISVRLH